MYLPILGIPFINIILLIIFSRFLGYFYVSLIVLFSIASSLLLSIFAFYEVCICGFDCNVPVFNWVCLGFINIDIELYFDSLSTTVIMMVSFISLLVFMFSVEYMYSDPHYIRFLIYLLSFSFFMFVFVTSTNFLQTLLGWEGIGLLSYLLINFWFTRIEANRAAMKAMIINKVGDFGLYAAFILSYYIFKSTDFFVIFSMCNDVSISDPEVLLNINYIAAFLLLAACGKSAQIGLHVWLADAMEGPTPVSALIHAATMVTAGIFLIIRFSCVFNLSSVILLVMIIVGALTAFLSSLLGLVQYDIKKIIAYSTCSQLGYMLYCCGLSCYSFALFHMFTHAFFKALLFLTAGAIIYYFNGEQDIRKMNSSVVVNPFVYMTLLVGSLALIGIPFLSGFYSKEFIILSSYNSSFGVSPFFSYALGMFTVICTSIYSLKAIIFFVINYYKNNIYDLSGTNNVKYIVEPKVFILLPLLLLSLSSIFVGYLFSDMMTGPASDFFKGSIQSYYFLNTNDYIFFEFSPWYIKLLPIIFILISFYFHAYLIRFEFWSVFNNTKVSAVLSILKNRYYIDLLYSMLVDLSFFYFHNILFKLFDKGLFDNFFGPLGVRSIFIFFNKNILSFIAKNLGLILDLIIKIFLFICLLNFVFVGLGHTIFVLLPLIVPIFIIVICIYKD